MSFQYLLRCDLKKIVGAGVGWRKKSRKRGGVDSGTIGNVSSS
jgi:hypothetical protein